MTQAIFNQLAPYLQDYIYRQEWTEFRPVQLAACEVLFEKSGHLLLASATASGKTEAAFLPILSLLHNTPSSTISVLYISPLKALINDQYTRLNDLLKESKTQVFAWHGDISSHRKRQLLDHPQGILQITPESLESLLINHTKNLSRLFGDLRFIIIDEIHTFLESQRGLQVLCQLVRLSRHTGITPRRIGLSATLGDYEVAKAWLTGGTTLETHAPTIPDTGRQVRLAVEQFTIDPDIPPTENPYYRHIFELTINSKSLIFANSRTDTEAVINSLRQIAKNEGLPDIYYTHHGSISGDFRQDAELAMRNDPVAVTAATLTLELGIDIGELERVIQLNAPFSVSSFLQRLGRTGRRGMPADMRFICQEKETESNTFAEQFPWQLLQCIAIIQLYLEDRWLEPLEPPKYPYSLLYQQTLSVLATHQELSPAALAEEVLSLPVFAAISLEDYRHLLRYWLQLDHLQETEQGNLILGIQGEKQVNNYQFYAVFESPVEYLVHGEAGKIGSIFNPPSLGAKLSLAGQTWQVLDIDKTRKMVLVKPVEGVGSMAWRGRGKLSIHQRILEKIRDILASDSHYPYLLENAARRLQESRLLFRRFQLAENPVIFEEGVYYLFPWLGSKRFNTLEKLIYIFLANKLDIKVRRSVRPYYFVLQSPNFLTWESIQQEIADLLATGLSSEDIASFLEIPQRDKYDEYIPNYLLRKAYAGDELELPLFTLG
ncbi:DEAD/DEAH box helicase [Spirulina sp. CS-785/01]|uniref:DEAD/DEAH box helicase n=1 Tax=Spirulina sp. CS-785/01 TaxID=3021716 RepID=UPI00232EB225|nr:DEAD/DEAH box helicase [Spirulina sp. CS-785/01]MDB9311654.1 DEAD/DEAH box helicase [Spirulina sp. CS-785/01]